MRKASLEKFKSHLNQAWCIGIICEPSYVHAKVMYKGQRSFEVKL